MRDFSEFDNDVNQSNLNGGIFIFEKQLEGLEGNEVKINDSIIEKVVILNHLNDMSEKKEERGVNARLNTTIKTGDYITYDSDTFLVTSGVDSHGYYKTCKMSKCNRTLTYKGLKSAPIPCRVYNDGYGVKSTNDNDINRTLSKKANIDIQINEHTKTIEPNKRYIFNNSKHSIYKVISINDTFTDGYMTLTCENDTMVAEDDLENNIAWNEDSVGTPPVDPTNYEIIGSDTIKINTIQEYKIQPYKIDILFTIDLPEYAEITSVSDGSVFVKGITRDENIMLTCKDLNGVVLAEKFIGVVR